MQTDPPQDEAIYLCIQMWSLNSEKSNDITSQESHLTELNFTQLHNNEWVYDTNVMTTKQETGVGDSERPFSSTGTTRPTESSGIHFEISRAYRPTLTEEEKKYLRQTPPYSLLLLHSSHKREHSCSVASWGKSQRQAMFKTCWFTCKMLRCLSCLVYKFGAPWNNHRSNVRKKKRLSQNWQTDHWIFIKCKCLLHPHFWHQCENQDLAAPASSTLA